MSTKCPAIAAAAAIARAVADDGVNVERAFTGREQVILGVLLLVAVVSAYMLWAGRLSL